MSFTDDDLKRLKEDCETWQRVEDDPYFEVTLSPSKIEALIARLEAAEIKECNQYHCGHATCNAWRKAAGK